MGRRYRLLLRIGQSGGTKISRLVSEEAYLKVCDTIYLSSGEDDGFSFVLSEAGMVCAWGGELWARITMGQRNELWPI